MRVFKLFFITVRNNLPVLAIYLVAFLAISVVQTNSLSSGESDMFQATSLNVGIIDKDRSDASRALTDFLSGRHNVRDVADDPEKNYDDLFYRYEDYILTIPEGFEEELAKQAGKAILGGQALPSSSASIFINTQIDEYLGAVTLRLSLGKDMKAALKGAADALAGLPRVKTLDMSRSGASPETESSGQTEDGRASDAEVVSSDDPVWYYFRYLPYILINLLILGIGAVLTALKDEEFERRVRISSMNMKVYRRQIVLACSVYGALVWAIFFAFGQLLYPGQMSGGQLLFSALNSLVFTFVSLSIAVLASSLTRGSKRAKASILNMVSNTVSLAMSFFCGIFIPLQYLGKGVKTVAHFLPAFWYIELNQAISSKTADFAKSGLSASFVSKCLLLQLLFSGVFLLIAGIIERRRSTLYG